MSFARPLILAGAALVWIGLGAGRLSAQGEESSPWPQFLGPARTGVSAETGLLKAWPADGPREVWRVPGGVGMSGMAIDRGRLFTLVQKEGQQWLVALKAASGETLWQTPLAPEYENPMGNGPRGTPAIAGNVVVAHTGEGILAACRFDDGRLLWSHDVVSELGGKPAEYGMAASPLVVGKLAIITAGAPDAAVVAYDLASGKLAWKAGDGPAGYSSPTLLTIGGKPCVAAFLGNQLIGLSPESGQVLFSHPFVTNYDCNIATPLEIDGRLFISAGENHGSSLLAVKKTGAGPKEAFTLKEEWKSHGPSSVLRSEWQTPALLDGYLYGMDNVGGAGPVTHLACVNALTGERAWRQTRFGKGNFLMADGKLFMTTMEGELVIAVASPEKYIELGRAVVIGPTRQAPALAQGLLYLRDDAEIVCLDVRATP